MMQSIKVKIVFEFLISLGIKKRHARNFITDSHYGKQWNVSELAVVTPNRVSIEDNLKTFLNSRKESPNVSNYSELNKLIEDFISSM